MSFAIKMVQFVVLTLIATQAAPAVVGQESNNEAVKITNSKLTGINMGLDSTQHWLEKMTAGDSKRGAALIADLEKLAARFNRVPKSDDEQYKFIVNRFASLTKAIQDKSVDSKTTPGKTKSTPGANNEVASKANPKIFTVNKNLDSMEKFMSSMDTSNVRQLSQLNDMFSYASRMCATIPATTHPDYVAVTERMKSMEGKIKSVTPQLASNESPELVMKQMREKYLRTLELPRAQKMMASRELTNEDVSKFLGSIERFQADIKTDLPKIRAAAAALGSSSDVVAWVAVESKTHIKEETDKLIRMLDRYVETAMMDAQNLAGLDVEKNKYSFVTESVRKNNEEKFARAMRTLDQAKSLEDAFNVPNRWSSKTVEIETHFATYREKASQAATVKKLPKEIGDASLAKIAKEVLAIEKYGVGEIERLIVNSKMVPRDRIETRYFNGALETIVRKWDEYQVCTVEKEGDKFFVYFNTLKKFSRAPGTTPIDKWILSNRFKSGEIAADKVN